MLQAQEIVEGVMAEIMVEQWSFCPKCRGAGCGECKKGVTVTLVPLESLQKPVRLEYVKFQRKFISSQRTQEEEQD